MIHVFHWFQPHCHCHIFTYHPEIIRGPTDKSIILLNIYLIIKEIYIEARFKMSNHIISSNSSLIMTASYLFGFTIKCSYFVKVMKGAQS